MKPKIIYCLLAFLSFLGLAYGQATQQPTPQEQADAIKIIKDYYAYCITGDEVYSPVGEVMTQNLIDRLKRMGASSDYDHVLRAQDSDPESLKTLRVTHLEGNWYMVKFNYGEEKSIPLRVTKINGRLLIDYITPGWDGAMYGDNMLCDNMTPQKVVDNTTPLEFLKTFYDAYTIEYCTMPLDLQKRLKAMREKYCTPKALKQFRAVEQEYEEDGPNYDLLIEGFDFYRLWRPSITYSSLDQDTYRVAFSKYSSVDLKIIKKDGAYRIDEIWSYDETSLCDMPAFKRDIAWNDYFSFNYFLLTFYWAYTSEYCSMSDGWTQRLKAIREKYCTPTALKQIQEAEAQNKKHPNYDLLMAGLGPKQLKKVPSMIYAVVSNGECWVSFGENASINLKAMKKDGHFLIDSITLSTKTYKPDENAVCDSTAPQKVIDNATPLEFLKTFYNAYTLEYCNASMDLINRLKILREKYCTPAALKQLQETEADYKKKYRRSYYDVLISGSRFNRSWLSFMTYDLVNNNEAYRVGFGKYSWVGLKLIKENGAYKINDIQESH